MIMAIIALVAFLMTLLTFFAKRLPFGKGNKLIRQTHCLMGGILLVAAVVHMLQTFELFKQRPIYLYLLGIMGVLCIMAALASYLFRQRLGKKWIVLHRSTTWLLGIIIVAHIGSYLYSVYDYKNKVNHITISQVDLTKIPDGVYEGECDIEFIYSKVAVTIKEGEITHIDILEHRNERGGSAESIISGIIKEQKVDVDTVSGATNSSKVIEKAIENALCNAKK